MQDENQKPNNFEERRAGYSDLSTDIYYIKRDISDIKQTLKDGGSIYITRTEFEPIKKIVYGLVSLILTSVVVALLALVIQKGN